MSHIIFSFSFLSDKVLKLVCGGSVINEEGGGGTVGQQVCITSQGKNLTLAQRHLERSSQGQTCGKNAAIHPKTFTSGLEIEYYPILTLR